MIFTMVWVVYEYLSCLFPAGQLKLTLSKNHDAVLKLSKDSQSTNCSYDQLEIVKHLLYIRIRWNKMLIIKVEIKTQHKSKPDIILLIFKFIDLCFRPYRQFLKLYLSYLTAVLSMNQTKDSNKYYNCQALFTEMQ